MEGMWLGLEAMASGSGKKWDCQGSNGLLGGVEVESRTGGHGTMRR